MKLHTSMLGTFFAYTLALSMPIFKKKSLRIFLGECFKLCIVVTLRQYKVHMELSPRNIHEDFFLKIGILSAKVYAKNVPNIEICNFIPSPLRTLSIKQVVLY